MSKYVFIYPHPDDESYNSGLLIQALRTQGHSVRLITLTKGGLGENHSTSTNLKLKRTKELQDSAKLLGIHSIKLFNYHDGTLKETLATWGPVLAKLLKDKADYVVTYDPSGTTGHPDHIALSEFIYKHWLARNNYKLLWYLPNFWQWQFYITNKSQTRYQPTNTLSGSLLAKLTKLKAIYQHESQFNKSLTNHLKHYLYILTSQESYHLVNDQDNPKFVYNTVIKK